MKSNQLTFILVGVLFLTTLATGGLLLRYHSAQKRVQTAQQDFLRMQNTERFMQSLVNEGAEYGKKDPGIHAVLWYATNNAPAGTPAPASAPPTVSPRR